MILKAKATRQSMWKDDPYAQYEQFRPEWFNFTTPPEEKAVNSRLYKEKESVIEMDSFKAAGKKAYGAYSVPPKPTRSKSYFQESSSFLNLLKRQWINEELFFAMNKLSLLGLVITLMFLGAVFFLSGFLMAVNVYGIGDPKAQAQMASVNPSHMPTPGYAQGHHQPTVIKAKQEKIAPQYATVGGVSMIPQPRLPSHMQQQQKPQPMVAQPVRSIVAAPAYPTQQYIQQHPYPPQMPAPQNINGYASYPAHVPAVVSPGYNPAYSGAQPPMVVPTAAPVYRPY